MVFDEEWRPAAGYEGLYEVSSFGRIKSLPRVTKRKRQGCLMVRGTIMSPSTTRGYKKTVLSCGDKRHNKSVHALVLESYCGDRPDGMWARHLDNDPSNNTIWNLCWDTPKNNVADRWTFGTEIIGSACSRSKLNEEKVLAIRRLYACTDASCNDLGELFGVNGSSVWKIVKGKSWSWLEDKSG